MIGKFYNQRLNGLTRIYNYHSQEGTVAHPCDLAFMKINSKVTVYNGDTYM
jgi:hypothetical protein